MTLFCSRSRATDRSLQLKNLYFHFHSPQIRSDFERQVVVILASLTFDLLSPQIRSDFEPMMRQVVVILASLAVTSTSSLSLGEVAVGRRQALSTIIGSATATVVSPWPAFASDDVNVDNSYAFERRDRKKNKDALVAEDYWYMTNKIPPRKLDLAQLPADDPTWNAWGTCSKSEATGNSCTYVSLKQRQPAYSKYAFNIELGRQEYEKLGKVLRQAAKSGPESPAWAEAAVLVDPGSGKDRLPSPVVDALLKMVLFATAMLTSPNYSGPSREMLVSRFYVNEAYHATNRLRDAIEARDADLALAAWEFGKDSWNSYFAILNRSIVKKVGDKFVEIV